MALIKVAGMVINFDKVAMIERSAGRRWSDTQKEFVHQGGILIHFDAGGKTFVEYPAAEQIESAFEEWDRDRPLPY